MQTDQIDTFLDLCETRSFNRTAERLGVTQSTVSGRIKALEDELGERLFDRSRAGTDLTTAGLRFEPHARTFKHGWAVALNAVRNTVDAAYRLRIGLQHDLVGDRIGAWLAVIREALPEASLYVEADFSTQMCDDIGRGEMDVAIVFTPKNLPDLHFETLGEMSYRMVSAETDQLSEVDVDSYILPNYSPAFARTHHILHPELSGATVSSGQATVIMGLLADLGGSTYLPENSIDPLLETGRFRQVRRAPVITQPVYGAIHLRNRHRAPHRRILRLLSDELARVGLPAPPVAR